MNVFSIAYNNFKNNMKTYTMFFISMVFSVVILSNFFILMNGEALKILGEANANYTKMILQMVSVVLGIFIFFFIWYTSNIFLKNRKKEIGLYTFMGVDSKTIGKIYFVEMMLIGLFSCFLGILTGVLLSKFFQMIVFSIAGFNVEVKFNITIDAIVYTFIVFIAIFILMSVKGFINIIRSKVIDLLNDSKKAEKIPKINVFTYIIAIVSLGLILYGYYLVIQSKTNALKTLILVCFGTYGVFYALIPAVLKFLINKKSILYKGENIIAINSLAYRLKKNYTTYATIGILTACTVSVLGTAVSMKKLYTMAIENDNLYSMSFYSKDAINDEKIKDALINIGDKKYELETTVLKAKSTLKDVEDWQNSDYVVLSYDQFTQILRTNGNEESLSKISKDMVKGNKAIYIQRPGTLASLINDEEVTVNDNLYEVTEGGLRFKTLGSLLNYETIVVNNEEYNKIKSSSEIINFYGIKVSNDDILLNQDIANKIVTELNPYLSKDMGIQVGVYKSQSIAWLRVVYAIGAFLFLVFVLAEASIIYTKIYSDANEDKYKYKILSNVGASKKELGRAISKEVALFYTLPLATGLIHSYFAIKVLGNFLSENLLGTFVLSMVICICIFILSYILSVRSFKGVVNVGK